MEGYFIENRNNGVTGLKMEGIVKWRGSKL